MNSGHGHPGADQFVRVVTASGDDLTDDSDPSRTMMRQIAGAFHQYEKARLVAKLKAARDRKRAAGGKAEGRKRWADVNPQLVQEAKRLRSTSLRPDRSLREIAEELANSVTSTSAAPCSRRRRSRRCWREGSAIARLGIRWIATG
jgi:DNA invertase Pin-like site-specific DNA recombinase